MPQILKDIAEAIQLTSHVYISEHYFFSHSSQFLIPKCLNNLRRSWRDVENREKRCYIPFLHPVGAHRKSWIVVKGPDDFLRPLVSGSHQFILFLPEEYSRIRRIQRFLVRQWIRYCQSTMAFVRFSFFYVFFFGSCDRFSSCSLGVGEHGLRSEHGLFVFLVLSP